MNLALSNSLLILHRAINFIFLFLAPYQTGGVQGEIEDQTWDALCEVVKDPVPALPNEE